MEKKSPAFWAGQGILMQVADLQTVYMLGEARLQVGGFVIVDNIDLSQLVQHGGNLREHFGCCGFFRGASQFLDRITGSLCIKPVMLSLVYRLTDTLQCRFVMCHFLTSKFFVARRGIEPLLPE